MGLESYLTVSAILFTLGAIIYISRQNTIAILMGVELALNAGALNFVAFSKFSPSWRSPLDGQVFALFIILLAAAEAVIALAIVLKTYQKFKEIKANKLTSLRG